MILPELPYMTGRRQIPHNKLQTLEFRGLNLTNSAGEGEFKDTIGLHTTGYPYLTQIPKRQEVDGYNNPIDVYSWDGSLYVVDDQDTLPPMAFLMKDGLPPQSIGIVTPGKKQMAVVNTKLVIFPDKKYVNLKNGRMHSLVSAKWNGDITLTDDGTAAVISGTNIGLHFSQGDVIDITYETARGDEDILFGDKTVTSVETNSLRFAPGSFGEILGTYAWNDVGVGMHIPDLDFICSSNNRLWGCNISNNTIYASALGDPSDFLGYGGDSGPYAVAVGSEGDFTGICNYGNSVLVWKENMLHKIMGSYPSEYYMTETPMYGVQQTSERSMVIINNVLYYKGVHGIYQYAGNRPVLISANLGDKTYSFATACTDGRKYYVHMAYPSGNFSLYSFDLARGFWMREDGGDSFVQIEAMAAQDLEGSGHRVFYVQDGKLITIGTAVDPALEWYGEFAEVTEGMFNRKGYLKLLMRLDMTPGSMITVLAKEDRKPYRKIWQQASTKKTTLLIPIRLGRCDRWQLKLEGVGEVTVRGIAREHVTGSVK